MIELQRIFIKGEESGLNLLILGCIHGNEVCGFNGIEEISKRISNKDIKIKKGSLTFLPKCNPLAFDFKKRCIDYDLNRIIKLYDNPKNEEENFANQVAKEIQKADYILDLHSMSNSDEPCIICEYPQNSMDFAKALGTDYVITGFQEAFCKQDSIPNKTTGHFVYKNKKIGLGVECGMHGSKYSSKVAIQVILDALKYLDMIDDMDYDKNFVLQTNQNPKTFLNIEIFQIKEKEGYMFKKYDHLEEVKQGDILVEYEDGEQIIAKKDYFMIMPNLNDNVKINSAWYFLASKI